MALFSNSRLESAIPLLQRELKMISAIDKICIAFPDDGAFKRFHNFFPDSQTIICTKVREGNKRNVKVKDGRFLVTKKRYARPRETKLFSFSPCSRYQETGMIVLGPVNARKTQGRGQ
jgi:hypothetical protein